ncbi:hypothetical protein [Sodalis sp. RH23]|uniref:hypothetical protein n=1 Tax=unclassified Sodalis (in: enterobacteria) TaxID=2636512 RepID=UPI0039B67673
MLKKLAVIVCMFSLTGCVVADMDSSNYTSVPYVQIFQKKGQHGHTDRAQRTRDLHACGVPENENPDSPRWQRVGVAPGQTVDQALARAHKLEQCMRDKGYDTLEFSECGPLKAPTGKCN